MCPAGGASRPSGTYASTGATSALPRRASDLLRQRLHPHVVLSQSHEGPVLLGPAGWHDDGRPAGSDQVADFRPGQLFEEDGVRGGSERSRDREQEQTRRRGQDLRPSQHDRMINGIERRRGNLLSENRIAGHGVAEPPADPVCCRRAVNPTTRRAVVGDERTLAELERLRPRLSSEQRPSLLQAHRARGGGDLVSLFAGGSDGEDLDR